MLARAQEDRADLPRANGHFVRLGMRVQGDVEVLAGGRPPSHYLPQMYLESDRHHGVSRDRDDRTVIPGCVTCRQHGEQYEGTAAKSRAHGSAIDNHLGDLVNFRSYRRVRVIDTLVAAGSVLSLVVFRARLLRTARR